MLSDMHGARLLNAAEGRDAVEAALRRAGRTADSFVLDQLLMFEGPLHYGGVLLLPDQALHAGDLSLDWDHRSPQNYRGVLAPGGLRVVGDLVNDNWDGGPFLLVDGPLEVGNLFKRGAPIIVLGPLRARGHVIAHYNHGLLHVQGDVSAAGMICHDHWWEVGGAIQAPLYTDAIFDPTGILDEALIEADPDTPDIRTPVDDLIEHMRARVLAGQPVFCPDAPRGKPK